MKKWVQKLAVCSIILSGLPYNLVDASMVEEANEITTEVLGTIGSTASEGATVASDSEVVLVNQEPVTEEQPGVVEPEQVVVEVAEEAVVDETAPKEIAEVTEGEEVLRPMPRSPEQFYLSVVGGSMLGRDAGQNLSYYANDGIKVTMNGHVNVDFNGTNSARLIKDGQLVVDYNGFQPNGYTFDATPYVALGDGEYRVQMLALKDNANEHDGPDNGNVYFYVLTIEASAIVAKPINPEASDFTFGNNREDKNATITLTLTDLNSGISKEITMENLQSELDKLDTGDYRITNNSTVSQNTRANVEISATDNASVNFKIEAGDVVVNHYINGETVPFLTSSQSGKLGSGFETEALAVEELKTAKPGYELDTAKSQPTVSGIYTKNLQIVDYYYKKKQTTVTVQYVDEVTRQPIEGMMSETLTGEFESRYSTDKKGTVGYEFVEVDPTGWPAEGFHGPENSTVTYVYKRVQTNLIVKHLDIQGLPIPDVAANTTQTVGSYKDTYTAKVAVIKGYRYVKLDAVSAPESGLYDINDKTVIFLYEKIPSKLIEQHLLEDGTKLLPDKATPGEYGDDYTTTVKVFEGYELAVTPANSTGEYGEDDTTVTYTYRKKDTQVIVHHETKGGLVLTAPETVIGKFSDAYVTTQKQFEGYRLVALPSNAKGTYTMSTPDVMYLYEKIPSNLIEQHLLEDGTKLVPDKATPGEYGDDYTTTVKDIEGYELVVPPVNSKGEYGEVDTTVTYTYRKKDTQVIVHHETKDGIVLTAPESLPGKFSDAYVTTQKEFEGYRLVAVPENAQGSYSMTTPDVKYVYEKIPSNLVIKHVDEQGKELSSTKVIAGEYGELYSTKEAEIEGYELIEVPVNQNGLYSDSDTTVTYIYKKKATEVIVHHVDQAGNKLADDSTINGFFNDDYNTAKLPISGYVYLLVKGAPQKGKHKVATQEVTYVYAKIVPPIVDTVYEGATNLTGTGTPGTQVIITFPDGTTVTVNVGEDGKWSVEVPQTVHLKEGQINSAISYDPETGFKSEKGNGKVLPLPQKTETSGSNGAVTKKPVTNKTTVNSSLPKTGEANPSTTIGAGLALLGLAVWNYLKRRKV